MYNGRYSILSLFDEKKKLFIYDCFFHVHKEFYLDLDIAFNMRRQTSYKRPMLHTTVMYIYMMVEFKKLT